MNNIFIDKNKKPHSISELRVDKLLNNSELLNMYSMLELHDLYEYYFGNYESMYKYILKAKIREYDKSEHVNGFNMGDKIHWLDKATRVGLMHLANCSSDSLQLVLGDKVLTFPVDFAKAFLAKLEVYAGQCYLQTQKHLIAVDKLNNVEDIINYDYTTGYPEKIVLE